ncbi:unnamed protein product [Toxocara canis]|uniref:Uncharacterized protein n=1 Tax=Toxocara canis TaxID=6265 RepID=A0A183TWQ9_TOXCA|nr:unnamed protein product [Toxocara canis]
MVEFEDFAHLMGHCRATQKDESFSPNQEVRVRGQLNDVWKIRNDKCRSLKLAAALEKGVSFRDDDVTELYYIFLNYMTYRCIRSRLTMQSKCFAMSLHNAVVAASSLSTIAFLKTPRDDRQTEKLAG